MKIGTKIMVTMIFAFLIAVPLISSQESLGVFKQNQCVELVQTCSDCTYVTFTRVNYPDGTLALSSASATQSGSVFNYTFCNTSQLGTYVVFGIGDAGGEDTVFAYDFEVTPSGQGGNSNMVFFIFIILMIYGITFMGFFGKNIPITLLGGMAMTFLGVYLIQQGIIIFRDNITIYFSYLTIGTGVITTFWALLEQLDVI